MGKTIATHTRNRSGFGSLATTWERAHEPRRDELGDDLLQSEDMPEPWDRWDEAVSHCQSASADISVSEDIDATVEALRAASDEAEE